VKLLDAAFEFANEYYEQHRDRATRLLESNNNNDVVRLGGFFAGLLRALYTCPGCDDGTVMHPSSDGRWAKCPQCGGIYDTSAIWQKAQRQGGLAQ